jgi:hypothetical protein
MQFRTPAEWRTTAELLTGFERSCYTRAMRICKIVVLALLLACWATLLDARVVRVEIASRQDVLGGQPFGKVGPYERITGKVHFAVPVGNIHNRRIVDLDKAVNLKNGEVEFTSDFYVVRPKDLQRGNGSMLLEVPNRGRPRIIGLVDGGDTDLSKSAGDGWLLVHGFTVAALGWQWDAVGNDALRLYAPAANDDGKKITGLLRGDVMLSEAMEDIPLGHLIIGSMGGSEYPVSEPNDPRNVLTVRDSRLAPRTEIPRAQWRFGRINNGKFEDSNRHIHLAGGFQPGKIYEYVYAVTDPVVAGLGFAAVRDFASYVKHNPQAIAPVKHVIAEGISQNGRFLRDFLYQGFNADEQGRMALDGVLAHVAGAGRGSFNYRFAQPSRDAQPTSSVFFPTDSFPFTDLPEVDSESGAKAGLLDRAVAEKVVPKIFFSNTSYEYWGRAASLIHTTADGKSDVPISPNVSIYHFTGLQHFSGPFPPVKGNGDLMGQQPQSPLPVKYFWRAMVQNMETWVRSNTAPPESQYPKIADATLVPLEKYAFPALPGVTRAQEANEAWRLDFGPNWRDGVLSLQPPKLGKSFPVLVPQVDEDGNERGGIRLPQVTVPLATYASWNLRDPSIGAPEQRVSFEGSYLPFAKTAEERKKSGDPRKSIAERYSGRGEYMKRFERALTELIRKKYVLEEDRSALLKLAEQEWELVSK